jgi:hypothetical protein
MGKIWQYVGSDDCVLLFITVVISYVHFFILWRVTVLCMVVPAFCEGLFIGFATSDRPWKEAVPAAVFVMVPYVPMVVLFVKRWGHFAF